MTLTDLFRSNLRTCAAHPSHSGCHRGDGDGDDDEDDDSEEGDDEDGEDEDGDDNNDEDEGDDVDDDDDNNNDGDEDDNERPVVRLLASRLSPLATLCLLLFLLLL